MGPPTAVSGRNSGGAGGGVRTGAAWQRQRCWPASKATHSSPAQSTSISKETHPHRASISRRSSDKQAQFLQTAVKMGRELTSYISLVPFYSAKSQGTVSPRDTGT